MGSTWLYKIWSADGSYPIVLLGYVVTLQVMFLSLPPGELQICFICKLYFDDPSQLQDYLFSHLVVEKNCKTCICLHSELLENFKPDQYRFWLSFLCFIAFQVHGRQQSFNRKELMDCLNHHLAIERRCKICSLELSLYNNATLILRWCPSCSSSSIQVHRVWQELCHDKPLAKLLEYPFGRTPQTRIMNELGMSVDYFLFSGNHI